MQQKRNKNNGTIRNARNAHYLIHTLIFSSIIARRENVRTLLEEYLRQENGEQRRNSNSGTIRNARNAENRIHTIILSSINARKENVRMLI